MNFTVFLFSGIHDHADSHCFMKVLDGNIQETLYGWPKDADTNEHLEPLKKNIYSRGQVAYINGRPWKKYMVVMER